MLAASIGQSSFTVVLNYTGHRQILTVPLTLSLPKNGHCWCWCILGDTQHTMKRWTTKIHVQWMDKHSKYIKRTNIQHKERTSNLCFLVSNGLCQITQEGCQASHPLQSDTGWWTSHCTALSKKNIIISVMVRVITIVTYHCPTLFDGHYTVLHSLKKCHHEHHGWSHHHHHLPLSNTGWWTSHHANALYKNNITITNVITVTFFIMVCACVSVHVCVCVCVYVCECVYLLVYCPWMSLLLLLYCPSLFLLFLLSSFLYSAQNSGIYLRFMLKKYFIIITITINPQNNITILTQNNKITVNMDATHNSDSDITAPTPDGDSTVTNSQYSYPDQHLPAGWWTWAWWEPEWCPRSCRSCPCTKIIIAHQRSRHLRTCCWITTWYKWKLMVPHERWENCLSFPNRCVVK